MRLSVSPGALSPDSVYTCMHIVFVHIRGRGILRLITWKYMCIAYVLACKKKQKEKKGKVTHPTTARTNKHNLL